VLCERKIDVNFSATGAIHRNFLISSRMRCRLWLASRRAAHMPLMKEPTWARVAD